MADLIAQGIEPQQRWRRTFAEDQQVVLGRTAGVWAVPWDQHVSRRHALLRWTGQGLEVVRIPEAHNPIYLRGKETAEFSLQPGEHFIIGQTRFTLADQRVNITAAPQPVQQQAFSAQYLKGIPFRNADHRLEVLSRLPEVISGSTGDHELFVRLVSMLMAGVGRADTVAVVAVVKEDCPSGKETPDAETPDAKTPDAEMPDAETQDTETLGEPATGGEDSEGRSVRVLHWDQRLAAAADFQPSERLIFEVIRQRQSVLHVWRGQPSAMSSLFTESENYDWAFCTPVLGKACRGWGLYVAGRFDAELAAAPSSSDPTDLREDVKFTELAAATLGSLREMRLLERQHASLAQFLSPVVLESIANEDPEVVLAPRETEVSVLFCDLRGFSRQSEKHADDLLALLNRVSQALGVMTRHIHTQGGVVGDYQGDAAMGFWGWPLAQQDAVERSCRAALGVRSEFAAAAQESQSTLAGFRAGIGIATGKAVAGKIGTIDQVKVTVFGPVVNLASRLEGMTKILRAPILLDEPTAAVIRQRVPRDVARVRRLAVVKPYGLDSPLEVSELLPPQSEYPQLTDEHVDHYEAAVTAFLDGQWTEAFAHLHRVPPDDRVTDFLTVFMAQHNRTPPPNWDGVIPMSSK